MSSTIFVTGATSGFGQATVHRFLKAGWHVIALGRRHERLHALAQQQGAGKIHPIVADIRDLTTIQAELSQLTADFGHIDVLVNNAGLALGTAPAQTADLDHWRRMIETNITGLVSLTRIVLPKLIERRGIIINMSSIAAKYPYPGGNVYGATKAFVTQLSLGLRSDLHGTGVRVTAIEPGMAQTEFTVVRNGGDQSASDAYYEQTNPIKAEEIAEMIYWITTLPPHLNINCLEVMPVSQSFAGFQIARHT